MQIFIPTMQRTHDQRTLNVLAGAGFHPILVVPRNELSDYRRVWRQCVACPAKGIAMTRQWIMDFAEADGHIVMMDDDLSFHVRRSDDPTKFTQATPVDVRRMVKSIDATLKKFAHVGVLAREGGNRITDPFVDCSRPLRVYAYNMKKVREAEVAYHKGLVQDDFDMTLQLLRKGYANRILCNFVNDQVTSNAPGGASTYRTMDVHNASVKKLAELHAPHVRVVEKQTKGAWQGQARLDVVISWKKAYAEGVEKYGAR